jgi:hypothetical protein
MELGSGQDLLHFRLVEKIGQGGMGEAGADRILLAERESRGSAGNLVLVVGW